MSREAVEFLKRYRPEGNWCLSAATPERDKLDTRTFSDPALALDWLDAWSGVRNCYFHVNPGRDENARSKLKREHVRCVTHLHVDIDPPNGQVSDMAFRDTTLGLLMKAKVPPSIIINSGNGIGAFWKLTVPLALDGTVTCADEAGLYNRKLAETYAGGDHCHNVDRLMRLPGTWNIPGESKRKKGIIDRRLSELLLFEDKTYPIESFQKASSESKQQSLLDEYECGAPVQLKELTELSKWNVPTRVQLICSKGSDPSSPKKGDNSRSAWLYDCVCQLIRFAVPDEVILGILLDPEWGISESVREKTSPGPEAYARRQIEKAKKDAKRGEHSPKPDGAPTASAGAPAATGGGAGRGNPPPHHDDTDDFTVDNNGTPYPTQRNIVIALRLMGVRLTHDDFAGRLHIDGLGGFGPSLTDEAVDRLWLEIDARYHFRPSHDFFKIVIRDTALRNGFHPILDYFATLTWDNTPRLDTWLIKHAGASDTAYTRAVSRLLLLAAVRRVRQPGAEFDEMLVLISPQGQGKSKSIKQLCPNPSWFSDDLPLGADSKVIIERLAGKWIVEAAELKGMRRSDVEQLKAFLSRVSDCARMAYGHLSKEVQRQFVLFGTTNSTRFLQDATGNRRYWPIQLTKEMDQYAVAKDRDQLWAEACHYEALGESIRLDRSLWDAAGTVQSSHRVEDPLLDVLQSALDNYEGFISSNDVWDLAQIGVERRNGMASTLGQVMTELGWKRGKGVRYMKVTDKREAYYHKGETEGELLVTLDGVTKRPKVSRAYDDPQRPF